MRSDRNLGALAGISIAIILTAGVLAAPVTVSPTNDAQGSVAALSGTGDASAADDCSYVPVPVTLPGCTAGGALTATGNATACSASGYGTTPCAGAAGSLVGDADSCPTADPSAGIFPNCAGAAASGTGDASACGENPKAYTDVPGCVGAAASGTGDSEACADAEDSNWPLGWFACAGVAASATGDASACGNDQTVTLDDSRCIGVALSGCDVASVVCTRRVELDAPSNVSMGEDADGDGFPSSITLELSRTTLDADNATTTSGPAPGVTLPVDPDDEDPDVPLAQEVRVRAPAGVTPGADQDGDGVPRNVAIEEAEVVVRRGTPPNVTITPRDDPIARVTLDANDNDPNVPVLTILRASYVSGVSVGPDADRDGLPARITIEFSTLTVDRRAPENATIVRDPARDQVVRPDANDNDPNVPVVSTFRASVPTNVALGPDADGDGFPVTTTIEFSTLTVDRRAPQNATLVRDPVRDQRFTTDANDNDPNVPVQSVFRASVPTNVAFGADADGDGFPVTTTIEFSTLTLDRRMPANATLLRDPTRDMRFTTDANDNDPNVPVASSVTASFPSNVVAGPDQDGDGLPSTITIESSRVTVDRRDPTNATLVRDAANDRTIMVDPDDADFDNNDVVGLGVDGDAEGDVAAFSLFGDAQACGDSLACLALSGAGTARGYLAVSAIGDAESCELDFLCSAASGTGDARAHDVAASATGDAEARYLALSGTGDANGSVPLSVLGTCQGATCFSLEGDGHWLGATSSGDASGMVALTPEGAASGGLVGVSATGDAQGGLVAVSGTGDAQSGLVAASGSGDASAPVSVP